MKKKLLAMLLVLTLVMSMFTGCSDDKDKKSDKEGTKTETQDSSYFKEVKKLASVKTGKAKTSINVTVKANEVPTEAEAQAVLEMLKVKDGEYAADIILESKTESDSKASVKISVKLGAGETMELGTLAIDGTVLYVDIQPILDVIKQNSPELETQIDAALSQYGVAPVMSLNISKFVEALINMAGDEAANITAIMESLNITEEQVQATMDFVNKVMDAVDKDFAGIQGTDGDDYTLTVGSDNAEAVVNALISFIEEDGEALVNAFVDYAISLYGEDSEMGRQMREALESEDLASEIADIVKEAKEEKDETVQGLKDANVNVVSKILVTGEEGSRKGKFSIDTGDIAVEDGMTISATITSEIEEGGISADIPKNATDVTETLVSFLTLFAATGSQGTGLY